MERLDAPGGLAGSWVVFHLGVAIEVTVFSLNTEEQRLVWCHSHHPFPHCMVGSAVFSVRKNPTIHKATGLYVLVEMYYLISITWMNRPGFVRGLVT